MDFNEIMQKIMEFINNNTLLLIGICVFLILVLIGYLIDNSVKSKRIRKDIKNADQVPENIKNEIIKEAKEEEVKEKTPELSASVSNDNVELNIDNNVNEISDVTMPELNTSNDGIALDVDNNINQNLETPEINLDTNINEETQIGLENAPLDFDVAPTPESINIELTDPDAAIMSGNNNDYKNDRRLSEILSNVNSFSNTTVQTIPENNIEEKQESSNLDIFTTNTPEIVVDDSVKKDDVQINNDNSSDELDRIMRKLSAMNNKVEDDNYTNIF